MEEYLIEKKGSFFESPKIKSIWQLESALDYIGMKNSHFRNILFFKIKDEECLNNKDFLGEIEDTFYNLRKEGKVTLRQGFYSRKDKNLYLKFKNPINLSEFETFMLEVKRMLSELKKKDI